MPTAIRSRLMALVLLAGAAPCLAADDAARFVNDLFGDRIRVVTATIQKGDDIELAKQMLEAAESAKEQPAVAAAIGEKAADLASKDPAGYGIALKALDLAASLAPNEEKKTDLRERSIALRQRALAAAKGEERAKIAGELVTILIAAGQERLATGDTTGALGDFRKALSTANSIRDERTDSLRASIDALLARQRAEQQLSAVQTRLLKDGGDQAAIDELLQLCVVDLDDAARAKPVLAIIRDEDARRKLTLAAKPAGELSEAEAREMGDWYRDLAQKSKPTARHALLSRAQACYGIYLVRHGERDLPGKAARIALNEVDASLKALMPKPSPLNPPKEKKLAGPWRDLTAKLGKFSEWTPAAGTWVEKEGRIRGRGDSRIAFKHKLPQDFTLEFKMNVLDGMRPRMFFGGLDFSFANEGFNKTIWVYGGGVSDVQGSPWNYANAREMQITIRFLGEQVSLTIDGKPVLTCKRKHIKACELDFRGGDGWSPGTTEFYDFRITPAKESKEK